ncbi:MAG: type I methionyl aminopeptidase [Atribacterota bacterium]
MSIFVEERDIRRLRQSGRILASVLQEIKQYILPGMKTKIIDEIAEDLIQKNGAIPAFKGYRGYPASLCISINEQVVHGIPGDRGIEEGDLVSIDAGVDFEGFFSDSAYSVVAGDHNVVAERIVDVAQKSLLEGIKHAIPGNKIGDISFAIEKEVKNAGYSVVRDFVGHGLGRTLHEEPQIPNYGRKNEGPFIKKGMVLAIEPMVNEKSFRVSILDDGWTVVTEDGGLSAHYEHTVLITDHGPEILTLWTRGDDEGE